MPVETPPTKHLLLLLQIARTPGNHLRDGRQRVLSHVRGGVRRLRLLFLFDAARHQHLHRLRARLRGAHRLRHVILLTLGDGLRRHHGGVGGATRLFQLAALPRLRLARAFALQTHLAAKVRDGVSRRAHLRHHQRRHRLGAAERLQRVRDGIGGTRGDGGTSGDGGMSGDGGRRGFEPRRRNVLRADGDAVDLLRGGGCAEHLVDGPGGDHGVVVVEERGRRRGAGRGARPRGTSRSPAGAVAGVGVGDGGWRGGGRGDASVRRGADLLLERALLSLPTRALAAKREVLRLEVDEVAADVAGPLGGMQAPLRVARTRATRAARARELGRGPFPPVAPSDVVAPRPASRRSFARFAARLRRSSRCLAVFLARASASSRSRSRARNDIAATGQGAPGVPPSVECDATEKGGRGFGFAPIECVVAKITILETNGSRLVENAIQRGISQKTFCMGEHS